MIKNDILFLYYTFDFIVLNRKNHCLKKYNIILDIDFLNMQFNYPIHLIF